MTDRPPITITLSHGPKVSPGASHGVNIDLHGAEWYVEQGLTDDVLMILAGEMMRIVIERSHSTLMSTTDGQHSEWLKNPPAGEQAPTHEA